MTKRTGTEARRRNLHDRWAQWMYRAGRPNRVAASMNRVWAWVGAAGLVRSWMLTLEVRGRKSGRVVSFPLVIARVGSQRYLVSMLGDGASWVANVRAAGGEAVVRQGRRTPVLLVELPVAERAPILKAFLQAAPGARPHMPVDRHADLAAFEEIAPRYPVFRITERRA